MIHPDYERYLSSLPEPSTAEVMTSLDRRREFRQRALDQRGPLEEMADVRDGVIALEDRTLRFRLFVPPVERSGALVVYFHGGSFVVGDLDTHEALCRRLSVDTSLRFLAIDYRLAPEHPFPAAIDDAIDTLRYVVRHVEEFAAPGTKVIAMGDSAGASWVAVAAASTRGELALAGQVLIYPTLGPEVVTDSSHRYATGYLLEMAQLRLDYQAYLGEWTDHTDARVTPLFADDLSGAAPAIIVVAECDPLRDEGVAYAGLLEHFAVPVELLEAEGMLHGFLRMGHVIPDAMGIVDDLAAHLRDLIGDA
ncbi:MAG: alpha/beta hydrolase [Acidobacteriota bacterium]|nr:alpha/beta hydrolase [Acidobacteriota bacterium]